MPRRAAKSVKNDTNKKTPRAESLSLENDVFLRDKCRIIGKNVRIERKDRKMSIGTLAECIELSASYMGLIERGDRCPSLRSLLKLCELFEVRPNELLLERKPAAETAVVTKKEVKEGARQNSYNAVTSLLYGLDASELECVKDILIALRNRNKRREPSDPGTDHDPLEYGKKKRRTL